jgi:hypothetical protein
LLRGFVVAAFFPPLPRPLVAPRAVELEPREEDAFRPELRPVGNPGSGQSRLGCTVSIGVELKVASRVIGVSFLHATPDQPLLAFAVMAFLATFEALATGRARCPPCLGRDRL